MDERTIKDLALSGITPEVAEQCGIYSVDDASEIFPEFRKGYTATAFQYLDPLDPENVLSFKRNGQEYGFERIRYTGSLISARHFRRYDQPHNSGVHPYFPAIIPWADVFGSGCDIFITEGEKKAIRLCMEGYPCIGLGGVYNYMMGGAFLPELAQIPWADHPASIVYDSDASSNANVRTAMYRLAGELSTKRGATVSNIILPPTPEGGKQGLDDYLQAAGVEGFEELMEQAQSLSAIDAAVLEMSSEAALIESEEKIYDIRHGKWMASGWFQKGSRFGTVKRYVPSPNNNSVKEVSVAEKYLTHPNAARYADTTFFPMPDMPTVEEDGVVRLNTYRPITGQPGNVDLFLELSDHIFKELPPSLRDYPIKYMAYKAQNPHRKPHIAMLLVGATQGSGKSLWLSTIKKAFEPYGKALNSTAVKAGFNGWLETTLIATIDEVQPEHLREGSESFKSLITEEDKSMNEKFMKEREVKNYCTFLMSSNKAASAQFSGMDRRFFVIPVHGVKDEAWYVEKYVPWLEAGGGKKVWNYLVNMDLQGWRPNGRAPMTAEKAIAAEEGMTDIQKIAKQMHEADENVVLMWVKMAWNWAEDVIKNIDDAGMVKQARDLRLTLPHLQIRDIYSAEELSMLFPSIFQAFHGRYKDSKITPGKISEKLRDEGIRYVRNTVEAEKFRTRGGAHQYLIVANSDEWDNPISQNDFTRYMDNCPTAGEVCKLQEGSKAI